ncbi:MAG: transporter, partial [Candidatus Binatia bacterium]
MQQGKCFARRVLFLSWCLALLLLLSAVAAPSAEKDPIDALADNSFLVEEAYNQEPGVVQHVFNAVYVKDSARRGWTFNFTQEWPIFSEDHQFSYSIPSSRLRDEGQRQTGVGDVVLSYRYQLLEEGRIKPAVAPRFGLVLPTGDRDKGTGDGVVGYEWQIPISKKLSPRWALHANAGGAYLPDARARLDSGLSPRRSLVSYSLGGSAVFAFSAWVHGLLEWVGNWEAGIDDNGRKERVFQSILSPGIRAAVIHEEKLQTVLGIGLPVGLNRAAENFGVFLY